MLLVHVVKVAKEGLHLVFLAFKFFFQVCLLFLVLSVAQFLLCLERLDVGLEFLDHLLRFLGFDLRSGKLVLELLLHRVELVRQFLSELYKFFSFNRKLLTHSLFTDASESLALGPECLQFDK